MSILLTASESASAGSMIPLILMYVVVFGVFFYFVLYRPQKKEQKKTSAMLSTLEIGDCVSDHQRLLRNHHRHHR